MLAAQTQIASSGDRWRHERGAVPDTSNKTRQMSLLSRTLPAHTCSTWLEHV